MNTILKEDLKYIFDKIGNNINKFKDSNIFITGCCGFLGYYFLHFFNAYKEALGIKSIVAVDNFQSGHPDWIEKLAQENKIDFQVFDIIDGDINKINLDKTNSFVIHMASIASPVFYRKYPIKTMNFR